MNSKLFDDILDKLIDFVQKHKNDEIISFLSNMKTWTTEKKFDFVQNTLKENADLIDMFVDILLKKYKLQISDNDKTTFKTYILQLIESI